MNLGVDEWTCIATHVIDRSMYLKKVRVDDIFVSLAVLCKHPDYMRHVRSEMKRLYLGIHLSWHRRRVDILRRGLASWNVDVFQSFRFQGEERCSLLFRNQTTSCLIGFLVKRGNTITFSGVQTLYDEHVFPRMQETDILCPVFVNHKKS